MMPRTELIGWIGKTKTAARRVVSEHLNTMPIDTRFGDKWVEALVQYHPSKSYPAANVVFVICARPPYYTRSLFVEARTGGLVDCSWVKCIANLFGGYDTEKQVKTKVLAALRNEAFNSEAMQTAREGLGNCCSRCQKVCKRLVVDHSNKPFARIVDEFLESQGETLASLKVRFCRGTFKLSTRAMSKAWRSFHDAEATFEGLCVQCNCSLGSGGYRHEKKKKKGID
jgi:hypothetical protein